MNTIKLGDVVIINTTGQAGTVSEILAPDMLQVILRNGEVYHGAPTSVRIPQSQEDLDAAPIDVDRLVPKKPKKASR